MVGRKPLHNFNLPPGLTWGRQKFLRCINVDQVHTIPAVNNDESTDTGDHNNHHSINNHLDTSPTTPPPLQAADPSLEKKVTRPRRNLEKKEDRPKFSIALSRNEIEEDIIAMTGKKPPRKRNKLSKSVQKKLNAVFPGSQLSEVHPDRYEVNESMFGSRRQCK